MYWAKQMFQSRALWIYKRLLQGTGHSDPISPFYSHSSSLEFIEK